MYASNSVHHAPMEIAPPPTIKYLTQLCPHTVLLATHDLSMLTIVTSLYIDVSSYTVSMAHVTYQSSPAISDSIGSLIDRGTNGGLAGAGVHVLEYTERYSDITGVGQASINALPLVTCAGTVHMTQGLVRELDLAICSPSLNGSKMRSLWTDQKKS